MEVSYENRLNTCSDGLLDPYTVQGQVQVAAGGTRVRPAAHVDGLSWVVSFVFPDAPAPVTGDLDPDTGKYLGETGPVDIGNDVTWNERWHGTEKGETPFLIAVDESDGKAVLLGSGTALVEVVRDGQVPCNQDLDLEVAWPGPSGG